MEFRNLATVKTLCIQTNAEHRETFVLPRRRRRLRGFDYFLNDIPLLHSQRMVCKQNIATNRNLAKRRRLGSRAGSSTKNLYSILSSTFEKVHSTKEPAKESKKWHGLADTLYSYCRTQSCSSWEPLDKIRISLTDVFDPLLFHPESLWTTISCK